MIKSIGYGEGGCKWSIGTREKIDIWEQNWLKEVLSITTLSNMQRPGDINKLKDIIMSNSKSWDIDKISSMFDSTTVRCIINTPLLASVRTDKLVWKLEHDGVYLVRNAYNYYVNNVGNQDNYGIAGNWHQICRSVQYLEHCAVCNDSACRRQHTYFVSLSTQYIMLAASRTVESNQCRNAKVWNNITESNTNVYERAQHLLTSWKQAQQTRSYANTPHRDDQGRYVAAKTEWLEPILDVEIGEAMGLFSAVKWVDELRLCDVDFEMDCKRE
ncbi:hypothetical protein TSUD_149570 [Trifolium subterraneum]|uniref:RNase H type-1 domain-containing protein n=1 Tax=Trifolium subterraneum TaxID=3900 RepID=A0A2Z6PAI0_TRISU|nr:hypothetical protein TSUD_149570 [Trifolium subterraneum]